MRALGLALMCVAGIGGLASAADWPTAEQLIGAVVEKEGPEIAAVREAIAPLVKQDANAANELLREVVRKYPKLPPAEIIMALAHFGKGLLPAGRGWLENAAAKAPDDPEAYVLMASFAIREGRRTEAGLLLAAARERLETYSANASRRERLLQQTIDGQLGLAETGQRWADAERILQEMLRQHPKDAGVALRTARAMFFAGKVEEAQALFQKAYDLGVEQGSKYVPPPEINLGLLYEQSAAQAADPAKQAELKAKARGLMAAVVKKEPQNARVQLAVAQWAWDSGDLAIAKRCAQAAIDIDNKALAGRWLLGLAAAQERDFAAAETQFRETLALAPNRAEVVHELALTLAEQADPKKKQEAVQVAEGLAKSFTDLSQPISRNLQVAYVWTLHCAGRDREAEEGLAKVQQAGGLSGDALYLAARFYAETGRPEQAKPMLAALLGSQVPFTRKKAARELAEKLGK